MHKVVPEAVQNEFFEMTRWWLLHLEGCKTGAKENGKPIAFDLVTSLELQEAGLPVAARHVGALLTDQLSLMELPKCQILGAFRSKQWESTCSSWLGMAGGPVLTYDESKKGLDRYRLHTAAQSRTVPQSKRTACRPASARSTSTRSRRAIHAISNYTTHVVPMAQVWPWIRDIDRGRQSGSDRSRARGRRGTEGGTRRSCS